MRAWLIVLPVLLSAGELRAQGNPSDFNRPGPVKEREMYYAQVRTEINNLLIHWREAWEKDDAKALAAFYTDGATYFPLHGAQAQTRAAIQSHFDDFLRSVGTLHLNLSGFGMSGDLAYVTCRVSYHYFDGVAERKVTRTDLVVLRRQRSHDWLIEMHMSQAEPEERPQP